ncbi:hypothetical protein PVAND_003743 [Polypedilum vanderplanki]|uniref:Timeless N-terminal domain-containing protein n=1 Tax=Polypedilum vanderplanki TaxID=319348 RepID=A0A9J6BW06_POLVA|nr:hypothetical protein PVAND_003743 [Polypedilum vanderplanki]
MSILLSDIDATCASLGFHDKDKYYIENDTLQSLKHLIWILKRDNLDSHECRRYMGHKKVLQTDLIPMLAHYCNHDIISDVLLRLIVNLTSPAILFFRQDLPKTNTGRQIYLDLVEISYTFKEAFANSLKTWVALVNYLKKIIDIDIANRTEEQNVTIERILILTRNVLQVPANPQNEKRVDNDLSIHDQILCALHESGMFELILYILCSHYESQFYLHALELIYLIFRDQNAKTLATSPLKRSTAEKHIDEQALIIAREIEKAKSMRKLPPARHSRFGGTYVYRNMKSVSDDKDLICHQPLEKVVNNDLSIGKKKTKLNFRLIKDEERYDRQSAFCVRSFLHEFSNDILITAFNNLIVQTRRLLERSQAKDSAIGYDQSYLLWAIRFFLQFNRFKGFNMECVTKAISKETIHWITLQIQHDSEMILSDKKKKLIWNRRMELGILAYSEFLQSLHAMENVENEEVKMLSSDLKYRIFNTTELNEVILNQISHFNENANTRMCLRTLIEAANTLLNMMEKFNNESYIPFVKEKKHKEKTKELIKKSPKISKKEKLEAQWNDEILPKVTTILSNDDLGEESKTVLEINEDQDIEDQIEVQIKNIQDFLNEDEFEKAILLLKACRNTWNVEEFGTKEDELIDELTILKDIFMTESADDFWAEFNNSSMNDENEEATSANEEKNHEEEEQETLQCSKSFADVEKRLINQKVVRACVFVLQSWENSTYHEIKSAVTILHRIAVNQKFPIMLMQSQLFRIFQQVFDAPVDQRYEELRRIGIFIVRQFTKLTQTNPKMYAELLFYKTHRECYDIENNYDEQRHENYNEKKKWTEEEEKELRRLYMLNQESPETDEDVIDWIVDNLSSKTKNRRSVIKKLKDLGLIFKAPTKKSNATAVNKNLFIREEDDKLFELYNEFRLEEDCVAKIMEVFNKKRTKNAVIKRMVQLGLIADESELMPIKPIKKNKKKVSMPHEFPQSDEDSEEREKEKIDSENDSEEEDICKIVKKKKRIIYDLQKESELLSPKDKQQSSDEEVKEEIVSKKRQLFQSDSEEDENNISVNSEHKKKIRRIIDSDNDD